MGEVETLRTVSMRPNDSSTPRYVEGLVEHLEGAPMGTVLHVEIRHDDNCRIFRGRPCNCDPEIESGVRVDRKYGGNE